MSKGLHQLWQDERGANLFEYVLLVASALTVIVAIRALYTAISDKFSGAAQALDGI